MIDLLPIFEEESHCVAYPPASDFQELRLQIGTTMPRLPLTIKDYANQILLFLIQNVRGDREVGGLTKLELTCKHARVWEVNDNQPYYHLRVADGNQPGNHAAPVMTNQDTLAVPCDPEKHADIMVKKQVVTLLSRLRVTFLRSFLPLPHQYPLQVIHFKNVCVSVPVCVPVSVYVPVHVLTLIIPVCLDTRSGVQGQPGLYNILSQEIK